MTKEEAIADAKVRANRSGMVWYVVNFPYGYDCVTEQYICHGNMKKTDRTEPKLNWRMDKKQKEIVASILKNTKK